jgi:LmbE family N-acetylglucosaminyl deacetylase
LIIRNETFQFPSVCFPRLWHKKLTVLGIGAHPSDAFPRIGGTLAKHAKRGDNVILLSVTYGIHVHTERLRDKSVEEIKDIVREKGTEPRL